MARKNSKEPAGEPAEVIGEPAEVISRAAAIDVVKDTGMGVHQGAAS
jgi:hypothetical protein